MLNETSRLKSRGGRVRLMVLGAIALAGSALSATTALADPVVRTQQGDVVGVEAGPLSVFRGIPYAAPPVGALRWRAPRPPDAWNRRSATAFGPACIQPVSAVQDAAFGPLGVQSEDCLTLNVWTPTRNPGSSLPVMVWIHGGGFVSGAGSLPAYDGSTLARQGVVVVTLNYRLGALGFFAHPALDQESPDGPVNFGLLDQIAALQWVRDNIGAFGGDTGNVTILGESAGAESVLALFASPLAQGLFHKGIAQSPYGIPSHSPAKARAAGIEVAKALELDGEHASAAALRGIAAEAFATITGRGASLAPSLVYGDAVLPARILDRFEQGQSAALPLVIGNNSNEASVAELFGIDPASLVQKLGVAKIAVRLLFPEATDDADLARHAVRDAVFGAFVKRIADQHSRRAPAWRYYFNYLPEQQQGTEPGAPHGGEIAFVLGTLDRTPAYRDIRTPADDRVAERMTAYWLAFARTGRPAPTGEPDWRRSTARRSRTMEFSDDAVLRTRFRDRQLNILIRVIRILDSIVGH
jgi:para-nitrobenzyl esterase